MKKVLTLVIVVVLTLGALFALSGCTFPNVEDNIKNVNGYYVYKIYSSGEIPESYALFGADDDKIINGVLTVPEEINGIPVTSLGYRLMLISWDGGRRPAVPMLENDKIKKIVINSQVYIWGGALDTLEELKELECNAEISLEFRYNRGQILAMTVTNPQYHGELYDLFDLSNCRYIRLNSNSRETIQALHSKSLVAYFIPNATKILESSFEENELLSAFLIPDTVTEINKTAFKNCDIDVYVRYSQDECPEGLQNGWDEGVNVVWGFTDEIAIFDTMFGSAVTFESTNKNYQIAKIGDKLQCPTQPTREGYTFTGWYKDYALSEQWDFETDTVQDSMVLVAGWQAI